MKALKNAFQPKKKASYPTRTRSAALAYIEKLKRDDVEIPTILPAAIQCYEAKPTKFWTDDIPLAPMSKYENALKFLYYGNKQREAGSKMHDAFSCVALYGFVQAYLRYWNAQYFTDELAGYCADIITEGVPSCNRVNVIEDLRGCYKRGVVYYEYAHRLGGERAQSQGPVGASYGILFYLFYLAPSTM